MLKANSFADAEHLVFFPLGSLVTLNDLHKAALTMAAMLALL